MLVAQIAYDSNAGDLLIRILNVGNPHQRSAIL